MSTLPEPLLESVFFEMRNAIVAQDEDRLRLAWETWPRASQDQVSLPVLMALEAMKPTSLAWLIGWGAPWDFSVVERWVWALKKKRHRNSKRSSWEALGMLFLSTRDQKSAQNAFVKVLLESPKRCLPDPKDSTVAQWARPFWHEVVEFDSLCKMALTPLQALWLKGRVDLVAWALDSGADSHQVAVNSVLPAWSLERAVLEGQGFDVKASAEDPTSQMLKGYFCSYPPSADAWSAISPLLKQRMLDKALPSALPVAVGRRF